MTILNFPPSPAVNDQYTANNKTYIWNGTNWAHYAAGYNTIGYTGSIGDPGY